MSNIYHQAEIVPLHSQFNCLHTLQGAERQMCICIGALKGISEHRPDLLNAELLRFAHAEIEKLIRTANTSTLLTKLSKEGIVRHV